MSEELIYFTCVKANSKLRVRIISPGFNHEANCQFPRAIRLEGRKYSAPRSNLSFAQNNGKFFYRVSKHNIKIIDDIPEQKIKMDKIYETEECVICMENDNEVVMYPCGHFCMCKSCSDQIIKTTNKCPLCRKQITMAVTRDQLQI